MFYFSLHTKLLTSVSTYIRTILRKVIRIVLSQNFFIAKYKNNEFYEQFFRVKFQKYFFSCFLIIRYNKINAKIYKVYSLTTHHQILWKFTVEYHKVESMVLFSFYLHQRNYFKYSHPKQNVFYLQMTLSSTKLITCSIIFLLLIIYFKNKINSF